MQINHRPPMTSNNQGLTTTIHNEPTTTTTTTTTRNNNPHLRVPIFLSPFLLALLLSFSFLLFLCFQIPHHRTTTTSNFSLTISSLPTPSHTLIISSRPTHPIISALRQAGLTGPISETNPNHLAPSPPPFQDASFDLVFSDAFDKATDGAQFAQAVERKLREGGLCVLLVATHTEKVAPLFQASEVVEVKRVDGFGSLNTQIILRKPKKEKNE